MTSDQAILRTTLLPGLVEAARTGVDAGADARRALRDRPRLPARRASSCPTSAGASPAIVAGGYAAVEGRRSRRSTTRSALELAVERGVARRSSIPGKAAETEAGWLGELHPTLLEGTWGAFELDLETLFAARARADRLRGRHHVPGGPAGHRGRRGRGRRGRRARRRGARGGGRRSCARRASSTSTAASRWARDASPSRSTSRSSRPSGRSPTRRRRRLAAHRRRARRALRRRAARLSNPIARRRVETR